MFDGSALCPLANTCSFKTTQEQSELVGKVPNNVAQSEAGCNIIMRRYRMDLVSVKG